MRLRTVEAREVRVGDDIYNTAADHPAFRWCRVVRVEPGPPVEGSIYKSVRLVTSGWATVKHEREGVTIRRFSSNEIGIPPATLSKG